jgi:hypothetical protein
VTKERIKEWCAYYKASPQKYNMNALLAVLKNDGEPMLAAVLRELGLERSLDLVKDAAKNDAD